MVAFLQFDKGCQNSTLPLHHEQINRYGYDGLYYLGRTIFGKSFGNRGDGGKLRCDIHCGVTQIGRSRAVRVKLVLWAV